MRKIALGLIAIGIGLTVAGVSLRSAAWNGQEEAKERWSSEIPAREGESDLAFRLSFPSEEKDFIVMEEGSRDNLLRGPVRIEWSGAPGSGNCIIAAHRDTHFRCLKDLGVGEQVIVRHRGRTYRYQIVKLKVVSQSDTAFYGVTSKPVLTLVTCYPFSYLGSAPQRYIVRAELMETNG